MLPALAPPSRFLAIATTVPPHGHAGIERPLPTDGWGLFLPEEEAHRRSISTKPKAVHSAVTARG